MRINDLLLGLLLVLIGAITIWAAWDFPAMPRQRYGAGTFPTVIGGLLSILGALLAARGWRQHRPLLVWQGEIAMTRVALSLAAVAAAVAAYALLTPILGFPVVVPAMMTLLIGWLSRGRWVLAATVAVLATLLVWLAFAELLHVPLQMGLLERVVY